MSPALFANSTSRIPPLFDPVGQVTLGNPWGDAHVRPSRVHFDRSAAILLGSRGTPPGAKPEPGARRAPSGKELLFGLFRHLHESPDVLLGRPFRHAAAGAENQPSPSR